MPATTRSKTKRDTGDAPPSKPLSLPPKPLKRNAKAGPEQASKDPKSARKNGADLLESLRGEQDQELNDALGGEESGHSRSRYHGRGHGGRGRVEKQNNKETTSTVEDLEVVGTLETDGPNGSVSCPFVYSSKAYLCSAKLALRYHPSHFVRDAT